MAEVDDQLSNQKRIAQLIIDMSTVIGNQAAEAYTIHKLEVCLELLEGFWASYVENDMIIQRYVDNLKGRSYFKDQSYTRVQIIYINCKTWFKQNIAAKDVALQMPVNTAPTTSRTSMQSSLEFIKLQICSGVQRD